MRDRNQKMNEDQDQRRIIENQIPETQSSENQHEGNRIDDVNAGVINSNGPATKNVTSSSTTKNEVEEGDEQETNIRTVSQGEEFVRPEPSGRKHNVASESPLEGEQSSVLESANGEHVGKSSSRKATGSRTPQGKRRSKYNARKHGICSKELVLGNESPAEFELLGKGLWEDFPPHGTMDTEILNDLHVVLWNQRRAHRAINAIFAEKVDLSELDRRTEQEAQAWDSEQYGSNLGGMLRPGCNHFVLKKGIELLNGIRSSLEARGFCMEIDRDILKKLYGTGTYPQIRSGIFYMYVLTASRALEIQEGEQNPNPDKYKEIMLQMLDKEIEFLTASSNEVLQLDLERSKYRVDQTLLSRQAALDLYIRYDTYLSRETDRLLNRLERVQRMRKGQ